MKKVRRKCKTCGEWKKLTPSRAKTFKFCSNECRLNQPRPVSWYKKRCDIEMSKLVREKGHCERCGSTENLQHHHIVGRRNLTLRYDIINGLCLCYRCHFFQAHGGALEFIDWLDERFPSRMEYLRTARNKRTKLTQQDYQRIFKDIKQKNLNNLVFARN